MTQTTLDLLDPVIGLAECLLDEAETLQRKADSLYASDVEIARLETDAKVRREIAGLIFKVLVVERPNVIC